MVVACYHRAQPITSGEAERCGDVASSNVIYENAFF